MPIFSLVISLGLLAGLISWLWRETARNTSWQFVFFPAIGLKFLCGILLGWFYAGCCDTFNYQQGANLLTGIAHEDFNDYMRIVFLNEWTKPDLIAYKTFSNSFFFIKVLSFLNFLTGNNYYLNGLFLSLFSFAGCWVLARTLAGIFPGTEKAAMIALIFFPSVVFWNSGVMKEPVLMGALCFFWATVLKTLYFPDEKSWKTLLFILLMGWLLWKIKYFVAVIVYGLTAVWVVVHWARSRFVFLRSRLALFIGLPVIAVLIAFALSFLHRQFEPGFFFRHLVWNYQTLEAISLGKPIIQLSGLEPNLLSVLGHAPEALAGALFRPFFWEGDDVWYRVAGAENLMVLALFIGSLSFLKDWRKRNLPGFMFMLAAFVLILAVLVGLTTPNLGTLNRYRTAFLPFLVYLLLQAPFWHNVLRRASLKTITKGS